MPIAALEYIEADTTTRNIRKACHQVALAACMRGWEPGP
jgi:hypothetical protein